MASGAGVIAPIRAGKLVASAPALNDYREFTLMRIVNGGRRIPVAFDRSSLDGVEPVNYGRLERNPCCGGAKEDAR
jgi:hypothetical protein